MANRPATLTLPNGIVATYGYDAAGHRIQIGGSLARLRPPAAVSSASYNAANQLTNWGGAALSYDANGNLTGDGTNTYTWDSRNRLTGISGGATASFAYDGLGRRSSKTVAGTSTSFIYDGLNPVQELSGSTPTANLLAGGLDQWFARTDSSGTKSFLTDALGSPLALTDGSGTIQTQYGYEPYGKTTSTGAASSNAVQYTGRENDGTGLYYYRARYYAPSLGRFVAEDPIGFGGGWNTYAYVGGNPTNLIDPLGLWALGDPLPQGAVDFSAGLGDALLLGTGGYLRDQLGVDGGVDPCSDAYKGGAWSSFALGAGRLAYAGVAKAGSILAASGAEASAFRQTLKSAFRLGAAKNWRPPDLSKYPTDDALRAAAGRTNPFMNAYGAGVAAAGAAGGIGCGCQR